MAATPNTSRARAVPKPIVHRSDRNTVHNTILLSLTRKDCDSVLSRLEFVELPTHSVLNEISGPIKFAYFINSGLASILNVLSHGKSVEVGLTGKEGFVGLPLLVGFPTSPTQAVMQIGGTGYRVSAQDIADMLRRCPALEKSLNRYSQELALQVTQVAACNRLHDVEQRLARWLLMSQDRVGSSTFALTQQFLAHMLGTRSAMALAASTSSVISTKAKPRGKPVSRSLMM